MLKIEENAGNTLCYLCIRQSKVVVVNSLRSSKIPPVSTPPSKNTIIIIRITIFTHGDETIIGRHFK
ncbi:hypothetical protein Mgra_00006235 [Meloidogyne graminicola]|uniref:Uncharacterized protein n=1 Tax=Meloidogyne graminicola TaxID=189291 RepID=A0A8S9ZLZ2_9BILA|nr:hypothetical protein Mgra_00006235 [Meloidogyne graminicola]